MNLIELYNERIMVHPIPGKRYTEKQARIYKILRETVRSGTPRVYTPALLNLPRGSGKTIILLGLAKEFNIPLLVHGYTWERMLRRNFPGITILNSRNTAGFRGMNERFLVDEGVDVDSLIEQHIPVITGINGRTI